MSINNDNESVISKDKRALGTFIMSVMGSASILVGYYIFKNYELMLALFLYSAWFALLIFVGHLVYNHLGTLSPTEIEYIKNLINSQVQNIKNDTVTASTVTTDDNTSIDTTISDTQTTLTDTATNNTDVEYNDIVSESQESVN